MNKRAQVTIFIILAIMLVGGILFFVFGGKFRISQDATENPQQYMEKCVKDSIQSSQEILLQSNGFSKVEDNFVRYNNEKIPLLCTTSEFYSSCIPQEPAFLNSIQKTMENKVARDTENCFTKLVSELKSNGYSVQKEPTSLSLQIRAGEIFVYTDKPILLKKDEASTQIAPLEVSFSSNLFELIKTAQTIINYESTLCEFDLLDWQNYEKQVKIERYRTSDQTKIYTLTDKISNQQIKFAVRTCVMPAGI